MSFAGVCSRCIAAISNSDVVRLAVPIESTQHIADEHVRMGIPVVGRDDGRDSRATICGGSGGPYRGGREKSATIHNRRYYIVPSDVPRMGSPTSKVHTSFCGIIPCQGNSRRYMIWLTVEFKTEKAAKAIRRP